MLLQKLKSRTFRKFKNGLTLNTRLYIFIMFTVQNKLKKVIWQQ